jgi:peptide/nickel transport system substrate-binding protein
MDGLPRCGSAGSSHWKGTARETLDEDYILTARFPFAVDEGLSHPLPELYDRGNEHMVACHLKGFLREFEGTQRAELDLRSRCQAIVASRSLPFGDYVRFILAMHRQRAPLALVVVLGLLGSACSSDTVTSTTVATVATTASPDSSAITTTSEVARCPDVFCLVYHIRPEASWSDGRPVTAADFVFTQQVRSDPRAPAQTRMGYDLVTDVTEIDDKTVQFSLAEVYGPWQTLFDVVLPAHIEGVSEDEHGLSVTSGPFILGEWIPGESVTLQRNPVYWATSDPISGRSLGDVESIRFVFQESVRSALTSLGRGEVDVVNMRPLDWVIDDVAAMANVRYETAPGAFWDHIDFNFDDPLLSKSWVREVISLAVPREAIAEATVRTVDPLTPLLDNSVWMSNSFSYEAHYDAANDPERAEQLLVENSCVRDDDDIYACEGQRMSFVWLAAYGDPYRETLFEMTREALASIGVELIPRFMTPSDLFSSDVFFGGPEVWQLINFSWKAAADPYLGNGIYLCEGTAPNGYGSLNVGRYCNESVDTLIRSTESVVDPAERAALYNQADALYMSDLAMIPLYQRPEFLAWVNQVSGPSLNMSDSTVLWNVSAWTGKPEVVISIEEEPLSLHPARPRDGGAAMILAAMVSGAFGIDPELRFHPVLIESVETIVSGSP